MVAVVNCIKEQETDMNLQKCRHIISDDMDSKVICIPKQPGNDFQMDTCH